MNFGKRICLALAISLTVFGFYHCCYQILRQTGQADYFYEVVGYLVQYLHQPPDFDWLIDLFYFDHSRLRLS